MLDKNAFSPEHNSRIVVSPDDLSFEEDLIIHRPMMDFSGEYSDEEEEEEKEVEDNSPAIQRHQIQVNLALLIFTFYRKQVRTVKNYLFF